MLLIDRRPEGVIVPPGSKSISHRAIICSALSGTGRVRGLADNDDTRATLGCLEAFGVGHIRDGGDIMITSQAAQPKEGAVLRCGESGSTIRFMIPLAAAFGATVFFVGSERLMERPLDLYADSFAGRVTLNREGQMLKVSGQLSSGEYRLPGDVSSQFVTGLLFALPLIDGTSQIVVTSSLQSRSYVDLTLDCLEHFGIEIINENYHRFIVPGNQKYKGCDYCVEADYSSASFLLAAAALGCDTELAGLNPDSRQSDRRFLDILESCGASLRWTEDGLLKVTAGELGRVSVDVSEIPDLVPPLAAVMCFCRGGGEITNAARLRIKESDRLRAVTEELNRLGAHIEEGSDFLRIEEVKSLKGGICHAHNDHRIAMMVAVASTRATQPVYIDQEDCVKKSYPGFWKDFLKK